MNYNPEGKRRVGWPKARWFGVVKNDIRKVGVRKWRIEAKDRDGWWRTLEEVSGCCATDNDGGDGDFLYN
jgi:hypothetical protein